ncbi:MAG: thiol-activated cytolysin family protein [Deltaproteobacteria bacterium]|nr:thiol-activated cytolysin family protein [Deltaproteobacteria bacterium]
MTQALLRHRWFLALLVGCAGAGDPDVRTQIDDYVRNAGALDPAPVSREEGPMKDPTREGDYSCTTQDFKETRQYDRIVAFAANSEHLWPGSIVQPDALETGLFKPVLVRRSPVTFSISLENLAGRKSKRLDKPSLSSFREALSSILSAEVTGGTPASIFTTSEFVRSEKQLNLHVGANLEYQGLPVAAALDFGYDRQRNRTRLLLSYTQAYYTVDVDPFTMPADAFADDVTFSEVRSAIKPNIPPLYVSSVTYGRMVLFAFASDYSQDALRAALSFALSTPVSPIDSASSSGKGGKQADDEPDEGTSDGRCTNTACLEAKYRSILENTSITAYVVGGSGGDAAGVINGIDGLRAYISNGGNYSLESPGAPIAYKLAHLRDATPARFSLTEEFELSSCTRVSQRLRVVLKSIRVDHKGRDVGALELYGRIWATARERDSDLFKNDRKNAVSIAEGTSWPQSGNVNEATIDVVPQSGQSVTLSAQLWDRDLARDDEIGKGERTITFDDGWAREEETIRLTGNGADVLLTLALKPL